MRLCIDLDGVICQLRRPDQEYHELEPVPGAKEKLQALRDAGHYIILNTARHMKTCQGNVGLVIARKGAVTLDWLARHEIPYDEIYFGKPHADIYIDDNAYRFTDWASVSDDGSSLPLNKEKLAKLQQEAEAKSADGSASQPSEAGR